MRHLALTAFVIAAGTAQAQSIMPLAADGHGAVLSVVSKSCTSCPPLKKTEDTGYKVPVLQDRVQAVSVVEIDGQKKIVRTEHWMGGSPVVHISKVPDWMTADQLQALVDTGNGRSIEAEIHAVGQGGPIDFSARTGAVDGRDNGDSSLEKLPLRLN
jgi:hypothetical protein